MTLSRLHLMLLALFTIFTCVVLVYSQAHAQREAFAQNRVQVDWYCNYSGDELGEDIYWFPADPDTAKQLRALLDSMGLAPTIQLRAANVPIAVATIFGEERVIYYNQSLLRDLADNPEQKWVLLGVIAHEVGHHANGHLLRPQPGAPAPKPRPELELEADRFAGTALYRLGADDQRAQSAVNKVAQLFATATHPGRTARAAAVVNGWHFSRQTLRETNEATARRVLIMDSFVRRYEQSSQLTNAHFIKHIFLDLERAEKLHIAPEHLLVTKNFNEHDYVLSTKPDLVVIHLSSFFASQNTTIDLKEFAIANQEFRDFVTYLFEHRPGVKLLAYTRVPPDSGIWDAKTREAVRKSVQVQDTFLKRFGDRAALVYLDWNARFDQPAVVLAMKNGLRNILIAP